MTGSDNGPQMIGDSDGVVLNEAPAAMLLSDAVLAFLRWLRNEGLRPRVDWLHGESKDHRWRVTFGTSRPTHTSGEMFVDSRTGDPVFGRVFAGLRDPGVSFTELPAMRAYVRKRLVGTNRETYLPTSRYTTIDDRGMHSHVNTTSYPEALAQAQSAGHQVVELVYQYVEARPVATPAASASAAGDADARSTDKGQWNGECFTPGCTTTGAQGMSIWGGGIGTNDAHRCQRCLDAISLLVPDVPQRIRDLGLIDGEAFSAYVRRVTAMDHTELHERAGAVRARLTAAFAAFTRLLDAADPAMVRDNVAILAEYTDLFNPVTITTWWAAHRHGAGGTRL